MASFEDGFLNMMRRIEQTIPTANEKVKITQAGADIVKKGVGEAIREKHYGKGHNGIHLADSVITKDEKGTGNKLVGFTVKDKIDHGRVANFMNAGTIKIHADHFYDQAVKGANDAAFKAMAKKINGGDNE